MSRRPGKDTGVATIRTVSGDDGVAAYDVVEAYIILVVLYYVGVRSLWSIKTTTVAIVAPTNDGNGDGSGHLRIYQYNGSSWRQLGADIDGEAARDCEGCLRGCPPVPLRQPPGPA